MVVAYVVIHDYNRNYLPVLYHYRGIDAESLNTSKYGYTAEDIKP